MVLIQLEVAKLAAGSLGKPLPPLICPSDKLIMDTLSPSDPVQAVSLSAGCVGCKRLSH